MGFNRSRWVLGLTAVAVLVGSCAKSSPQAESTTTATLGPSATATTPTLSPTPAPTPTKTLSPTPTPSSTPTKHSPTDAERAAFVASFHPAAMHGVDNVAVNADSDSDLEIVFTYVPAGAEDSHVAVADWDGLAYRIVFEGDGGPADRNPRVEVRDIFHNSLPKIALFDFTGAGGASLALFTFRSPTAAGGPAYQPLLASGGCDNANHVYGVTGATLVDVDADGIPEVRATCETPGTPEASYPVDIYKWDGRTLVYIRTEHPAD